MLDVSGRHPDDTMQHDPGMLRVLFLHVIWDHAREPDGHWWWVQLTIGRLCTTFEWVLPCSPPKA